MTRFWRAIAIVTLVGVAAGVAGVYAGLALFSAAGPAHTSLDAAVHRELDLNPEQNRQLEAIEARYAARKRALEAEMRDAARAIADAVFEDRAQTPRVQQAIDRFHDAMGQMQHDAIAHVFEMREVLNLEQKVEFDEIVRAELLRGVDEPELPQP